MSMSTTSIKLSAELKQRATAAAEQQGLTTHAFMVQAIEKAAAAAERRADFIKDAQTSREGMLESGKGHDAGEVHSYLKSRIAGDAAVRPEAKSWRD